VKIRLAAAVAALACAALGVPAPAQADAGGTAIAVGGPAEPVVLRAGGSITTSMRIINGTATAERVALHLATLTPGNDGQLSVVDRADPGRKGRVGLPAEVTVPADGALAVPVKVTAPATLPADYYLIGCSPSRWSAREDRLSDAAGHLHRHRDVHADAHLLKSQPGRPSPVLFIRRMSPTY
jgi:hypothetical protein